MRKFLVFLLFFLSTPLIAEELGTYIDIRGEPGIQIYVDGILKGVTASSGKGLLIDGVASGSRKLKAIKDEYDPIEIERSLVDGDVFIWKINPFSAPTKINQYGECEVSTSLKKDTGDLQVRSVPNECKISIESGGIFGSVKEKLFWEASDIPVGTHTAKFNNGEESLEISIEIKRSEKVLLFVNFPRHSITKLLETVIWDPRNNNNVMVTGVIEKKTWEHPNGSPLSAFVIKTKTKILFRDKKSAPPDDIPLNEAHLIFDKTDPAKIKNLIGKSVEIQGDWLLGETAYYACPIAIKVREIKTLKN